jgi:4-amino-4-deoxy-L-arabinose transferase-like glycosyltransferase
MQAYMTDKIFDNIARALKYAILAGVILYLGAYIGIAVIRISYPFELEWMEGGSVDHVSRILAGQKLYVSPSMEFIPYIYTPFYFYLSALLSRIVGTGFLSLRLVSFLSSIGCFLMIFLLVKQETRSYYAGLLASGLFAATYRIGGAWFDLARPDILFLLLLLIAIYILRVKHSAMYTLIAGLCLSLAFLTKQTALSIALPIVLYLLFINWRRALYLIGILVIAVGGSTWLLDALHDGWYSYYIFAVPAQLPQARNEWLGFWQHDIVLPLAIALCVSLYYVSLYFQNRALKHNLFYAAVAGGMIGGAWLSKVYAGGYVNNSIPAHAALAILFGLAIHKLLHLFPGNTQAERSPNQLVPRKTLFQSYVYVICIVQFLALLYNPFNQVPNQQDLEAGKHFIETLGQFEGDVFLPAHGYLPTLAGKQSFAQEMAISNIVKGKNDDPVKLELLDEMRQAIQEQKFHAIILDHAWWFADEIEKYYERQADIFDNSTVFWPVTGHPVRPEMVYVVDKSRL